MFTHNSKRSFVFFPIWLVHSLPFHPYRVHSFRSYSYSSHSSSFVGFTVRTRTTTTRMSPSTFHSWTTTRPIASSTPLFLHNPLSLLFWNEEPTGGDAASFTRTGVIATAIAVPFCFLLLTVAYLYRGAILEKLRQLEDDSLFFNVQMARIPSFADPNSNSSSNSDHHQIGEEGTVFRNLQLLEMDPETRRLRNEQQGWQLISLGDYMRQLKPAMLPASISMKDVPTILQAEMGAALTAALLKALGPQLGRAVLPLTGMVTQGPTKALATALAGRALAMRTASSKTTVDRAGLPLNLMSVLAVSEVNAKVQEVWKGPSSVHTNGNTNSHNSKERELATEHATGTQRTTPIEKMTMGETGNDPSFASNEFIPSHRFCFETDFPQALQRMEAILTERADVAGQVCKDEGEMRGNLMNEIGGVAPSINSIGGYQPEGRAMSPPIPINPRLLPDLHLGWGDAQCTQTNREVLLNRLVATLMNRLASNYYRRYTGQGKEGDFTVVLRGKEITSPSGLIEALIESGHRVETAVTTHVTTFGIALCVKEKDGSFSNIPLACFLDSGYEDHQGNAASVAMPHSGLDLDISGPLLGDRGDGEPAKVSIQHYIAIDGFCGWYTNHNADVPWIRGIDCGPRLQGADAARAARFAAAYAMCLNGLATERDLPFGGYGLTAVCNDSAAVIEECLHGTCSIYPMTSIGSYMMRTVRYAAAVRDTFRNVDGMEQEVEALGMIITAMGKIPSDLNALPSYAASAAERILHGLPKNASFQLMTESRVVMESLLKEKAIEEVATTSIHLKNLRNVHSRE